MHSPSDHRISLAVAFLVGACLFPAATNAQQVRTKKPDRGVYQSPRLPSRSAPSKLADLVRSEAKIVDQRDPESEAVSSRKPESLRPRQRLVEVPLTSARGSNQIRRSQPNDKPRPASNPGNDDHRPAAEIVNSRPRLKATTPRLQPVDHEEVVLAPAGSARMASNEIVISPPVVSEGAATTVIEEPIVFHEAPIAHDSTCDGCPQCLDDGCDSYGCDSMGRCQPSLLQNWANCSIGWHPDRFFGGAEVMLMFRSGDHLPPLVTTTTDAAPDPETAGELGQAGTQILAGQNREFRDMTAGGRFTLGTWLDHQQCRSLVVRGWSATEDKFSFNADQDLFPVIARPFLNVSDGQAAEQDTQIVAFPDRATGSIVLGGSSDVFGGDIQVRQFAYCRYGATVDLLYGYQYMRLNEDLRIANTSTSLNDDFAPVGSLISVTDRFEAENEFHGGQLGLTTNYREGCWSFASLLKVGFGSLRRRAQLEGSTFTSIDGANAVDPNGLLVRSTNRGTINDDTFGWVPELDVSLGWQRYPQFDVTVGYNIIAMTEALQVSGIIDPDLASNLADPPTEDQRPTSALRYKTFYVQSIQFGVRYVY